MRKIHENLFYKYCIDRERICSKRNSIRWKSNPRRRIQREIEACQVVPQKVGIEKDIYIQSVGKGLEFKCYAHSPAIKRFFTNYQTENCGKTPVWKGCGDVKIHSAHVVVYSDESRANVSNAEYGSTVTFDYSFPTTGRTTEQN